MRDVRFENGVIGKVILYNMEERQRVKIVDYIGSDKVDQSKIEEELRDKGIQIRLDSFIDPGLIRRVAGIVRELYAAKGYMFAEVKPEIKEVAGWPKTVHVTFNISEGPKVQIRELEFIGNQKISDRALSKRMKENRPGMFSFIPAAAPTRKTSSARTRTRSSSTTATTATSPRRSASPI